jgi:hypothetical protein
MVMKKRKKRVDRNHAIYLLTVGKKSYIGVTVVVGGVSKSLQVRLNKHWYRREDPTRWDWAIYKALRRVERDEPTIVLLEVVRGKAEAHKRERELIKKLDPKLNSDTR